MTKPDGKLEVQTVVGFHVRKSKDTSEVVRRYQ